MKRAAVGRWRRRLAGVALLCAATFAPRDARAQDVELNAGATCLERARFVERLQAWLTDVPVNATLSIHVRGSDIDPRSAEVTVRRADGEQASRVFGPGPERCADLHDAVALAAALLVRALSTDAAPTAPAPAPSAPPPTPPPENVSPPEEPPHAPPPRPARIRPVRAATRPPAPWAREVLLGASGLASWDIGTRLGGGARLYAGLRLLRSLEVRLGAQGIASNQEHLPNTGGAFRTRLYAGVFETCVRSSQDPALVVRLCGGLAGGVQRTLGAAYARSPDTNLRWFAASLGPELGIPLTGSWSLSLGAALLIAFERAQVVAGTAQGRVLDQKALPRAGAVFSLGLARHFAWGTPQTAPRTQGIGVSTHE